MSMVARVNVAAGAATIYPTNGEGDPEHRDLFSMPDGTLVALHDGLYRAGSMDDLPGAMVATSGAPLAALPSPFVHLAGHVDQYVWVEDDRIVIIHYANGGNDYKVSVITVAPGGDSAAIQTFDLPRTRVDLNLDDELRSIAARPGEPIRALEMWIDELTDFTRFRLTALTSGGRSPMIDPIPISGPVAPVHEGFVYAIVAGPQGNRLAFQDPWDKVDVSHYSPRHDSSARATWEGPSGISACLFELFDGRGYYLALHGIFKLNGGLESTGRRFKTSRVPIW